MIMSENLKSPLFSPEFSRTPGTRLPSSILPFSIRLASSMVSTACPPAWVRTPAYRCRLETLSGARAYKWCRSPCVCLFRPQSEFFAVCIEFAPPPTAELKAAGKKLAKRGAGKPSSKKNGARGVGVATTAASESAAAVGARDLGEKVHHGDYGDKDGRGGRWRACLAESGKVGFVFWSCMIVRMVLFAFTFRGGR